ncbi:MAG TPA: L,D-transpeptidase [Chloroflexota bacterium]|jgi:lipoprotein-anchoring transpeptidase ErfK/SrfK
MLQRRHFLRLLSLSGFIALGVSSRALAAPATVTPVPRSPTATPAGASPTPAASPTAAPSPSPRAAASPTAASPTSAPTLAPSPTAAPAPPPTAQAWVQALRPIPLWSGPDDQAQQLGAAARWDYFLIAQSQNGPRLYVLVARTNDNAWVDALSVGPSGPPPAGWPPADQGAPSPDLSVGWVATATDAPVYADASGALLLGIAPAYTAFKQVEPQSGSRLHVQDPYSGANSWLDAASVGPIDPPSEIGTPGRWWGISAVEGANVRGQPTTRTDSIGTLTTGLPLVVSGWAAGEEVVPDNPTWAVLDGSTFVYSSVLRPVALPEAPPPPDSASSYRGRWIDLNLTQQVVVAYEGQNAVRLARTSTGRPGWETGAGNYTIQRRVANETMDSSSLIGLDAQRASYKVDNVRWTQYFSADGKALHENYWKPRDEFGIPSSHGCAGLVAEDALYFWNWADIGVPVIAHY